MMTLGTLTLCPIIYNTTATSEINQPIFNKSTPYYENALKKGGHNVSLKYTLTHTQDESNQQREQKKFSQRKNKCKKVISQTSRSSFSKSSYIS